MLLQRSLITSVVLWSLSIRNRNASLENTVEREFLLGINLGEKESLLINKEPISDIYQALTTEIEF